MRNLIIIITVIMLTACTDKGSEKAKTVINNSDYCLIYKRDSLSNDLLLFNVPTVDTIDYFKKILTFNGKFNKSKTISPNFRFDLIKEDSIIGEILIDNSKTPYLTIKTAALETSRQVDYQLGIYLGEIEQNVYSTKTDTKLTFRKKGGLNNKLFGFAKNTDSSNYSSFFIKEYFDDVKQNKHDLGTLMHAFEIFWKATARDTEIKLTTASVGTPLEYEDVLKRQIEGFQASVDWIEYVKRNGKKPNSELTKSIMLKSDVYKPLNDFLKIKGYKIVGYDLEKLSYLDSESLKDLGYKSKMIIPIPYMLWIKIGKTGSNNMEYE